MAKRVAVTGGAGWIGGWVVRELQAHDYEVVVLDRSLPPDEPGRRGLQPRVPGVRYRIGEHERLGDVLEVFHGCEAAIHLSAIPSPGAHPNPQLFQTNVMGTFNACEAAALLGLRALAMASSINTLGFGYRTHAFAPQFMPIDETHPNLPQDPYGLSKLVGEEIAAAIHRRTAGQLRVVSIRPSGVTRPWQYAGAAENLRERPTAGERSLFSYTDPRDLAVLFRLAIESDNPEAACTAVYAVQDDAWADRPVREVLPMAFPGTESLPGLDKLDGTQSGVSNAQARRLFGWNPQRSWRNPADHLPRPGA
ncbi:MAG TPA: NAD(P)-dependent oxidoreductase [Chloroflexota bacterium]|nr:NAD(P)-dependent oxidoreductase [Chloroflexota bacterium]